MTTEKILLEFDPELKYLLPALRKISAVFGYVSEHNAIAIAEYFRTTLSKVHETASFYDLINIKKQPQIVIQVCSGTNCAIGKSFEIIKEIENHLHIRSGDESNPSIKLEIISCIGQCGEGPILVVNSEVYQNVTESSVHDILAEWT
jgi:NADH-quinone oxidoreductase subunit E